MNGLVWLVLTKQSFRKGAYPAVHNYNLPCLYGRLYDPLLLAKRNACRGPT